MRYDVSVGSDVEGRCVRWVRYVIFEVLGREMMKVSFRVCDLDLSPLS